MQLLILILFAGVLGYFLARSRFSKPIDKAANSVGDATSNAVEAGKGWWGARFGKKPQVVDATSRDAEVIAQDPAAEPKKPAEKSVSRRKSEAPEQNEVL
jgi:hypothetical protein